MLKISENGSRDGKATIRLEGKVIGPWVVEVRRVCEALLASGREVVIDLAEVSFADREAIAVFKELTARRVTLVNCSPLMTEMLRNVAQ